jgi:hypothetical protein
MCLKTSNCAAASWNGPSNHFHDLNCNLHCTVTPTPSAGEMAVVVRNASTCGTPGPPPPAGPPHEAGRSCQAPTDWDAACKAGDLLFVPHECALCVLPANRRPEIGRTFTTIPPTLSTSLGSSTAVARRTPARGTRATGLAFHHHCRCTLRV